MKNVLPFFVVLLLALNTFAQIKFEAGYFIDESGNKTECLLKNNHLKSAPEQVKYKLDKKSEVYTLDLKNTKEFSIHNTYKFIKEIVEIGESNELNEKDKEYTFKSEEIFLKVLVEGKASLYSYSNKGNDTFFFSSNNLPFQQLVYKIYIAENFQAKRENNAYREQLFNNLKCNSLSFEYVVDLKYEKEDLIDFFIKYNECQNSENSVYLEKQKIFNINFRPRFSSSSLTLRERGGQVNLDSYDFSNKTIFGIGIEAEVLLPFTNNKWSISIEPTYQKYNSELTAKQVGSFYLTYKVDYTSLEMPLTVRHYSFINSNSKIFVNASIVFDFTNKSSIVKKFNEITINNLEIAPDLNFAFGAGYKFKNKYNLELRFYSKRNLVNQLIDWTSSYSSTSVIFGYTLF